MFEHGSYADGDEGLTGAYLAAAQPERRIDVRTDDASHGPDQQRDRQEGDESSERLWVAELCPEQLGAEATALGVAEVLFDLPSELLR